MYNKIIELDNELVGYKKDLLQFLLLECSKVVQTSSDDFNECEHKLTNIVETMKEIKEFNDNSLLRIKTNERSEKGYIIEELRAI